MYWNNPVEKKMSLNSHQNVTQLWHYWYPSDIFFSFLNEGKCVFIYSGIALYLVSSQHFKKHWLKELSIFFFLILRNKRWSSGILGPSKFLSLFFLNHFFHSHKMAATVPGILYRLDNIQQEKLLSLLFFKVKKAFLQTIPR